MYLSPIITEHGCMLSENEDCLVRMEDDLSTPPLWQAGEFNLFFGEYMCIL